MRRDLKRIYKFARLNPILSFRVSVIFLATFILLIFTSIHIFASSEDSNYQIKIRSNDSISLPEFDNDSIQVAEVRKEKEEARLAEIQKQVAIRQEHIDRINRFLVSKRSPVANTKIAGILYDSAEEYGTDYKILLAISGVESGFCAQSFHYNCFGYLNGVKYSSFEQAFSDIAPKVARDYASRYGTDFASLAKAYGMINWKKGASNLSLYYNQI